MKTNNRNMRRILTLLIAVALIFAALPFSALADSSFSAVVCVNSMKVYRDAYMTSYGASLSKDTVVTVSAYNGNVARIKYRGYTGYAAVSDMDAVSNKAKTAVTNTATRVYQKASTSSNYVLVKKGLSVNVLDTNGNCIKVEKNGYIGYMYGAHLSMDGTPMGSVEDTTGVEENPAEETPAVDTDNTATEPAQPSTIGDIFASGKYTNEELIYAFAIKVLGFNNAAAAGLLANIKAESSFNPGTNGDSGTSYGICQWHLGRKTRLISWCDSNGYDYKTLLGQLYYLQYELKTYYPAVNNYMKSVDNSAEGAYNAGYYFCYNFEAPASRATRSVTRGNTAKDTYYPKYTTTAV